MADISLKPSEVKQSLTACIAAKQPAFVWGEPGVGKSQVIKQVSATLGLICQDVRAVLLDPVDLRGLPHVNGNGRAHWAVPDFLPQEGEGVLFLDELNRAPTLVQNACFQLILDRQLGEYRLPDGWTVVAAGNRESHGGGVTRMVSALANRFIHLNMVPDLDEWCAWAVSGGINPPDVAALMSAFLRFKSDLLHEFEKNRNENSFPTPRSWEFVSKVIQQSQPQNIEHALVAGAVGAGAAVQFAAFVRLFRQLPSIDAILLDPSGAKVPNFGDVATLYAVSSALAARADKNNFGRVITYLDRIPPEYAVFSVKDAVSRDEELQRTPDFTKWAIAHADLM